MAGVRFDQNQIRPGVTKCRVTAVVVRVMESVVEGDLLVATGYDEESGLIEVHKADATSFARARGLFWIADYSLTIVGTAYKASAIAIDWKVMTADRYATGVLDTSGAAVGDLVYLSASSAGNSHYRNIPSSHSKGGELCCNPSDWSYR